MRAHVLRPGNGALLADALRIVHERDEDSARLEHWLAGAVHAVVALDGDAPVGLAYGYELPRVKTTGSHLLLYEIDVLPAHRRRGAGRAMLEALLRVVEERGLGGMWLLTDDGHAPAVALYEATGGERVDVPQVMYRYRRT